ncbi:alpha/beta hydrolase [Isosphaeraceae bacterium EP7]
MTRTSCPAWAFSILILASLPAVAADKQAADGVTVIPDVAYAAGGDRQKLDLYLPKGRTDFPVVLFFHGGGFKAGDRKSAANIGETFARRGVGVASVGYRLFPEVKHPVPAADGAAAFAWIKKNIGTYHGRADQIFVAGHSAGAILAAQIATDDRYLQSAGASTGDIRGAILLSGTYNLPENRTDVFGDAEERKAASPFSHARSGLAPFFLAYAERDNPGIEDQTKAFAAVLKAAGDETVVVLAKDRSHGTIASHVDENDPTADQALAFVKSRLDNR